MAEEEENKEEEEEEKEEETDMVTEAKKAVEEMKIQVAAMKVENDRKMQMLVKKTLGGGSEAGKAPEKPKEETPLEYSKRVVSGDMNG